MQMNEMNDGEKPRWLFGIISFYTSLVRFPMDYYWAKDIPGVLKLVCMPNLLAGEIFLQKKITSKFSKNHVIGIFLEQNHF